MVNLTRTTWWRIVALLMVSALVASCTTAESEDPETTTTSATSTTSPTSETTQPQESTSTTLAPANGEQETTLTVAYQTPVPTFDPTQSALVAGWYVWGLGYETLVVQQPDGTFAPSLATDWAISDDGLTYTFTLREDVKFHNGEVFEADDVVYTLERAIERGIPYTQARVSNIESVEAIDPTTVEITLTQHESGFLNNLGNPLPVAFGILNREAASTSDPGVFMVGTGPFRMVSYAPEQELVLERFDDYWGSTPSYERLVVRYMPEESTQLAALRAGEIDLMFPTEETALVLEGDTEIQLDSRTSANIMGLYINTQVEPLGDLRVRRAIALAIDAEEVVATAQFGLGTVSGVVSPVYDWAIKRGEHPNFPVNADEEAARALLAEAGYPDGFELELLSLSGFPTRERLIEVVAQQLERVGIDVTIVPAEVATWLDRFLNSNYSITANEGTYQADPFQYMRVRQERTGPLPEEVAAGEDGVVAATSPEELLDALTELQQAQMDNVYPFHVIVAKNAWVAHRQGSLTNVDYPFTLDWRFLAAVEMAP